MGKRLRLRASPAPAGRGEDDGPELVAADFLGQPLCPNTVALPSLADGERRAVVSTFTALVDAIAEANAENPGWWYTWLSCYDRLNSSLLGDLEFLAKLRALLAAGEGDSFCMVCPEPARAAAVAFLAADCGWQVWATPADRLAWWWRRWRERLRAPVRMLRGALYAWRWLKSARRHPCDPQELRDNDVLIVSILDGAVLRAGKAGYRDTYFGDLPERLQTQGERVLVCGFATDDLDEIAARAVEIESSPVVTFGHLMRWGDLVVAACRLLFHPIAIRHETGSRQRHLSALVRAGLKESETSRMLGFAVERAMRRLLVLNPEARLIHMYENNYWERACDRAARTSPGRRTITGYLHCAVLPAHLKNLAPLRAGDARPAPDRVVCTGPAAREVFLSLGDHDPARVFPGCALRGVDLGTLPARPGPPKRVATILVVLEGLWTMVPLIRYLAVAGALLDEAIAVRLRAHPALPVELLATRAGVTIAPGARLQPSPAPDLLSAYAEADAVLYQGSTAALPAVYMGIPLIRFDGDGLLPDDPLFECDALKRVVRWPEDLASACLHFEAMAEGCFHVEHAEARAYVERYLAQPTPENLAPFCRPRGETTAA